MQPTPAPLASYRIAILDDHKLFRQGVARLVSQFPGVEAVDEVGTFPELLKLFAVQLPGVLLLDLEMPEFDGVVVAEQLLARFPTLRIIVLSMHSADQFIHRLMKIGARSYLPKDVDQDLLREAIELVMTTGYYVNGAIARAMTQRSHTAALPVRSLSAFAQSAHLTAFTPREKEVLLLICQGLTTPEIAGQLFISPRTVEGHRQKLLEKTGVPNSAGLVSYAARQGLLAAPGVSEEAITNHSL